MAGVKGALTTLVYIVCSAANSAQYIPYGENPVKSFLSYRYVTVVFPEVIVHDYIRAAARKMHLSPGFTCTSLMGPTCLYASKQQGKRASSDNLTMWIHIAVDLLVPDSSDKSAHANEALPDHSEEGTVPVQPKAGQHQLKTTDSHLADAHGCEQLIDAATQTVSPSQLGAAAAEEPASECAAAVPQGGNGIMAQYLAASQDQLGAVHGRSDPGGKRWQRIGASSEGKLDDVVYVRVGKGSGVQSVYDRSFDGSMDPGPGSEGETQGVCQSNEKTQE